MSCVAYGAAVEDSLHLFQDCYVATEVWAMIWCESSLQDFVQMTIVGSFDMVNDFDCLLYNDSTPIQILSITLWRLWHW